MTTPANNSRPNNPKPRPTHSEIIEASAPQGFGRFSQRHYGEIFDEEGNFVPENEIPSYPGVGGHTSYHYYNYAQEQAFARQQPKPRGKRLFLLLEQDEDGVISFGVRSSTKVFLFLLATLYLFLHNPQFGDVISSLLKTALNQH